jgi:ribose 5-phosphate isomerase B
MKILIASDHAGYEKKERIIKFLKDYNVIDLGTNSKDSVDYPDYAISLSKKIANNEADFGILICMTGIGMSIASNKVKNIRCAKIDNYKEAKCAKEHNNANVIALSSKKSMFQIKKIIKTFLNANSFIEDRHLNRIKKIKEYENEC